MTSRVGIEEYHDHSRAGELLRSGGARGPGITPLNAHLGEDRVPVRPGIRRYRQREMPQQRHEDPHVQDAVWGSARFHLDWCPLCRSVSLLDSPLDHRLGPPISFLVYPCRWSGGHVPECSCGSYRPRLLETESPLDRSGPNHLEESDGWPHGPRGHLSRPRAMSHRRVLPWGTDG